MSDISTLTPTAVATRYSLSIYHTILYLTRFTLLSSHFLLAASKEAYTRHYDYNNEYD